MAIPSVEKWRGGHFVKNEKTAPSQIKNRWQTVSHHAPDNEFQVIIVRPEGLLNAKKEHRKRISVVQDSELIQLICPTANAVDLVVTQRAVCVALSSALWPLWIEEWRGSSLSLRRHSLFDVDLHCAYTHSISEHLKLVFFFVPKRAALFIRLIFWTPRECLNGIKPVY